PRLAKKEQVKNSTGFNSEDGPGKGAELTPPRQFNLMFKTYVGPVESEENVAYLRPETAQAIFAQFKSVLEVSRQKVPFGICQIGKAFRNEINPRNFTFRSREFEQMELEYFIRPDEAVEAICGSVALPAGPGHPGEPQPNWGWQLWHQYWVEERIRFYESIGLPRATLVEYWQKPEKLAREDAEGLTKGYYVPHVIEPSAGADRLALALICNAYSEDQAPDEKGKLESRVVLRFHPRIAPIKVAVLPLLKNKPDLVK